MNRHASGLKGVLTRLLLALTHPALAGSGANLRFEHEKRQDDGRQLESVTRVLNFGDATELRFKTTQVSGTNDLYSRKWGDYFFGLSFGRNGNGSWDVWDFLQVHSLENKKPVAFMRQRLPDSVTLFEQSGQILAGRDRSFDRAGEAGVPRGIPAPQRLLDPGEVVHRLDGGHVTHGLLEIPRFVGIEHEGGVVGVAAQLVGDDVQPTDVVGDHPAALQFAGGEAPLGHRAVEAGELVVVECDVQSRGVARDEAVAAAEQAPERFAGELGLDVPEGGVESSDATVGGATVTVPLLLALDGREESLEVMVRAGRDSSDALVGFENDDRHLGDTGLDESVDITDGTSPIVEAAKAAVPGDLHHRP